MAYNLTSVYEDLSYWGGSIVFSKSNFQSLNIKEKSLMIGNLGWENSFIKKAFKTSQGKTELT